MHPQSQQFVIAYMMEVSPPDSGSRLLSSETFINSFEAILSQI